MNLDGKVAIVTGAGRGLGRAYANALARAGASVVVNDADKAVAEEAVEGISAGGGRAVVHAAPVGSTETAEALVRTAVDSFGRLDILVTNAGILRDKVVWKMSDEDFDLVVQVHLKGTFTCARAAINRMREQGDGGRLIFVGSPAGQRGNFGQTNYSAAKAGIVGMARTLSLEVARAKITANAVIPIAATPMTETIPAFAPYIEAWRDRGEPLPSWLRKAEGFGTPDDAAALVVFLASDAAAGVSGQAIGIGGDRLSLWSHPKEVAVAFADNGWTPDAITETWASSIGRQPESVGIPPPQAPDSDVAKGGS